MQHCSQCGSPVSGNFCSNCGTATTEREDLTRSIFSSTLEPLLYVFTNVGNLFRYDAFCTDVKRGKLSLSRTIVVLVCAHSLFFFILQYVKPATSAPMNGQVQAFWNLYNTDFIEPIFMVFSTAVGLVPIHFLLRGKTSVAFSRLITGSLLTYYAVFVPLLPLEMYLFSGTFNAANYGAKALQYWSLGLTAFAGASEFVISLFTMRLTKTLYARNSIWNFAVVFFTYIINMMAGIFVTYELSLITNSITSTLH